MRRWLKRIASTLGAVALVGVVLAAVCGVPAPPGVTTSGVPRVPWAPLADGIGVARRMFASTSFSAWDPAGPVVIRATTGLRPRHHRVAQPGAAAVDLDLPNRTGAVRFNPEPQAGYLVYALDSGGNEDHQLYRFDLDAGTSTLLTDGSSRNIVGEFDRQGTRIAFTSNRRNGRDSDVYVMDPTKPDSATMVYAVEGSWWPGDWSPSGDRLLLLHFMSSESSVPYVLDIAAGTVSRVGPEVAGSYAGLTWGTDPNTVYYLTSAGAEFRRLFEVSLITGEARPLGPDPGWDTTAVDVAPDGSVLAVLINEDGSHRPYFVDPGTGERTAIGVGSGTARGLAFHPTRAEVAMTLTGTDGIGSVHSATPEGALTVWSQPEAADDDALPAPRLFRYPTFDKVGEREDDERRTIPAVVFDPPAEADAAAPVFIVIHGGPAGQSRPVSNPIYDVVRRRFGAAIIAPNVRGSRGYGNTYMALDNGFAREDSVRDIGALLDWIAAEPGYDADRVIVYGGSYGGYMVLASMVHYPDRLRCGIDVVGISDFVTFLENTRAYRRDLRRAEYGDERDPQMRQFLTGIAPAAHAELIRGRLMVLQGENDPRVPVSESRQLVQRLQQLQREVWYLEFDNEGHGLRLPQNVAYAATVGFEFLQGCLQQETK